MHPLCLAKIIRLLLITLIGALFFQPLINLSSGRSLAAPETTTTFRPLDDDDEDEHEDEEHRLFVANNGVDSPTCGPSESPCRSITRAIANAQDGERIIVGPGTYGDVNADGIFTIGSGDELPNGGAMIAITKRLTILSRDGAAATIIRFSSGGIASSAIRLTAVGLKFGKRDRGFSVVGDGVSCGVGVIEDGLGAQAAIAGNVVTRCGRGFQVSSAGVVLKHNKAIANSNVGFFVESENAAVEHNGAIANGDIGFFISSLKWRLESNVAINNKFDGAFVDGHGKFIGNAMIGNGAFGLNVNGFLVAGIVNVEINSNSFYGNLGNSFYGTFPNCAMFNNTFTILDAQENFWGASAGPGADPADQICGNQIKALPALTSEPRIVLKRLR